MSLILKIKQSVESLNVPDYDIRFAYHSGGTLDYLLDRITFDKSAKYNAYCFLYLLENSALVESAGMMRERADIILYFAERTAFDFNSFENEAIIERCKQNAVKWARSIREKNELKQVSELSIVRLYDQFDINLTGVGLRLTVMESVGETVCEDWNKEGVFTLQFNKVFA